MRLCAECGVISMGFYLKSYATYGANTEKLAVYPWFSSRHNMGMALDRATWDRIRNCSKVPLPFPLLASQLHPSPALLHLRRLQLGLEPHARQHGLPRPQQTHRPLRQSPSRLSHRRLVPPLPPSPSPLSHPGPCSGVHHKCTADTSANKYAAILADVKAKLFPAKLEVGGQGRIGKGGKRGPGSQVSERSKRMLRPPKENGGWGDVRDHELCLNNTRFPAPAPAASHSLS